jgi:hypothetical protein
MTVLVIVVMAFVLVETPRWMSWRQQVRQPQGSLPVSR